MIRSIIKDISHLALLEELAAFTSIVLFAVCVVFVAVAIR